MYRLYIFLGTCSVFRLPHTFWTYFSVDFAPKQIRSKPWYLWIYNSFCNLLSTLKVTENMKRTMLKLSEFNEDCVCVVLWRIYFLFPLFSSSFALKYDSKCDHFLFVCMRTKKCQCAAAQQRYPKMKKIP